MFKRFLMAGVALLGAAMMTPAMAQTPQSGPAKAKAVEASIVFKHADLKSFAVSVWASDTASAVPAADSALSEGDLADLRGEGGPTYAAVSNQTLTGITTGNTIAADVLNSGAISIGDYAFSGFEGIGNFVINSGHNNTLQSSLSVNIVIGN